MSGQALNFHDDDLLDFKTTSEITNKSIPTLHRYIKDEIFPKPEKVETASGKYIFLGFKWAKLREWREDPNAWVEKNRTERQMGQAA